MRSAQRREPQQRRKASRASRSPNALRRDSSSDIRRTVNAKPAHAAIGIDVEAHVGELLRGGLQLLLEVVARMGLEFRLRKNLFPAEIRAIEEVGGDELLA